MRNHHRSTAPRPTATLVIALCGLLCGACSQEGAGPAREVRKGPDPASTTVRDATITDSQRELLETAFKAVSLMPTNPHVKNRSRGQEAVVDACLAMGLPQTALRFTEQITNWRRGLEYARYALWCIENGHASVAPRWLDRAAEIARGQQGQAESQAWRRDRIRAAIATGWLLLGEAGKAAGFGKGLTDSEQGPWAAAHAARIDPAVFDAQLASLDATIASGNIDQVRAALEACVALFERFYDEPARRAAAEERVRSGYAKLPPQVRVEMLKKIAAIALKREDRAKAAELVREAFSCFGEAQWQPRDFIAVRASLAALLFRAGEVEPARKELDSLITVYDSYRERIIDIYRAGALRPVAEAFAVMGEPATALKLYRRAIEEGCVNHNGRPRAHDLSASCLSMARHGVEPDETLAGRITAILAGLRAPW